MEAGKSKGKGPLFGVGREKMTGSSVLGNISTNPGPGRYELGSTLSDIKFSIRPRLEDNSQRKEAFPGIFVF